ncbi:MAG: deoxyribonuclease IV [Lachnospira sp.]|nr:deoxyribonuclease IV [Lachnospira sp.]
MLRIGCHLSSSKGFLSMAKESASIDAGTFQFFTRNPRGGKGKEWPAKDIDEYTEFAKNHDISRILAHAPYTLNPCAKDEDLRKFAYETMLDDLNKMQVLPDGCMYNFHPGSHVSQGSEKGIEYISDMLNRLETKKFKTRVLLETMSGKGSEVGRTFEELRAIIDRLEDSSNIGICLDTCHVFDGGYDIVGNLDGVLDEFDKVLGLDRLCAIHLNDSKNGLGSHKDRHELIGEGNIGLNALAGVINNKRLQGIPVYLETPTETEGHGKEIALLKSLYVE